MEEGHLKEVFDTVEAMVLDRAMGRVRLVALKGPRGIERCGRRPSTRFAKKRLKALSRAEGEKKIVSASGILYIRSKDARDYAAARVAVRQINRRCKRAWEGLSDQERAEAIDKARMSMMPIMGVAGVAGMVWRTLGPSKLRGD